MIEQLDPYHPDLALLGAGLGAASLLVHRWSTAGRVWWSALEVAPLAAVSWLAFLGHLPTRAAIAVLLAVAALRATPSPSGASTSTPTGRGALRWALVVLAVAAAATARPGQTVAATSIIVVSVAGAAWLERDPRSVGAGSAVLVVVALAATFLGGPDTEAAVLAGACLMLALAGVAWDDRRLQLASATAAASRAWPLLPSIVLTAIIAADAYRGRPAGLPAALVAGAALVAAAAWRAPLRWSLLPLAAVPVVVARTLGLAQEATAASWGAAAAISAAVVVGSLVGGRAEASAAPARTPPG